MALDFYYKDISDWIWQNTDDWEWIDVSSSSSESSESSESSSSESSSSESSASSESSSSESSESYQPGIARGVTRMTLDTCEGTVLTPLQSSVFANGYLVAVIGTPIAPHPPCPKSPIHCDAVMSTGSSDTFAENIAVCRRGDYCNCGHTSTGSSDTFVN